jgi:hypothetical protein
MVNIHHSPLTIHDSRFTIDDLKHKRMKSSSLKLHIPEPCHESWKDMTPKEQGRFCASCSKIVVDFSVMTDRQMLDYFTNYSGNTCGRFANDQLNRVIDPQVRHSKGWFRYMLAAMLPAVFFGGRAYAQGKPVPPAPDTTVIPMKVGEVEKIVGDTIVVPDVDTLVFAMPDTVYCEFSDMVLGGFISGIEIIEEPVFAKFTRFITDSLRGQSFSLYPNPTRPGGAINISYKITKGDYYIQVLDANGRLMQQQAVNLNNDVNTLAFRLGAHYARGQYMLLLADNKRRKIGAKQFIIQ